MGPSTVTYSQIPELLNIKKGSGVTDLTIRFQVPWNTDHIQDVSYIHVSQDSTSGKSPESRSVPCKVRKPPGTKKLSKEKY